MENPEQAAQSSRPAAAAGPVKALLIDERSLCLAAFGAALLRCAADVRLVSVETAQAVHDVLAIGQAFDVVLLNLQRHDGAGFELLARLRGACPSTPVVVASNVDTNSEIVRAIYLGATGFVPMRASSEVFLEALRVVRSGQIFMPPMFVRSSAVSRLSQGSRGADHETHRPSVSLTRRQTDVLELLMEGQSNKSIARRLNLSVDPIKDHVAGLLRTLNVKSRTQAVIAASRMAGSSVVADSSRGARQADISMPA